MMSTRSRGHSTYSRSDHSANAGPRQLATSSASLSLSERSHVRPSVRQFDKLVRDLSRYKSGGGTEGAEGGAVIDARVREAFRTFDRDNRYVTDSRHVTLMRTAY